jgi:hypothetical protein
MSLSAEQVVQLLKPINNARVLNDGKGHAHVSQQDILAHLIRVFGFGNFDIEVLAVDCIFEQPREDTNGKPTGRYDVCYRALVRLTIRDQEGRQVCQYENGSTATAQNQSRGDAHDLAYKSAISLSVKRAAIALGDQFGLSLYNKGQLTALVRGVIGPDDRLTPSNKRGRDIQEGIEQQVSLGHDEVDVPLTADDPLDHPAERVKATPDDDPFYDTAPREAGDRQVSKEQLAKMGVLMKEAGITDRDKALLYVSDVVGRKIATRNDLTRTEASKVINALQADLEQPFPEASA